MHLFLGSVLRWIHMYGILGSIFCSIITNTFFYCFYVFTFSPCGTITIKTFVIHCNSVFIAFTTYLGPFYSYKRMIICVNYFTWEMPLVVSFACTIIYNNRESGTPSLLSSKYLHVAQFTLSLFLSNSASLSWNLLHHY